MEKKNANHCPVGSVYCEKKYIDICKGVYLRNSVEILFLNFIRALSTTEWAMVSKTHCNVAGERI